MILCCNTTSSKLDLILHLTIRRPHFLVQLGVLALSKTSATATADELGRERFVGPLKPPCVEIVRQDHVGVFFDDAYLTAREHPHCIYRRFYSLFISFFFSKIKK